MIRDLQIGFGVFQKLEFGQCRLPERFKNVMPPTGPGGFRALKHNMLVNIGDAHIFVSLLPTGGSDL